MLGYAGGDGDSFRELFRRFAPIVMRALERQVGKGADAEELAQQTFLQLHRARRDFRAGMKLRPWIVTIALNLARDLLRRRVRRPETAIEAVEQRLAAPEPEARDEEIGARVRDAVGRLPADQRQVIELHWFAELSFQEIAAVVGASSGAVRVRASRGYTRLREELGDAVPRESE